MKNQITKQLKEIEQKCQVTILFACETGSRAWGFPSTDSDYDVRFIYMHPPEWYLSIDEQKDNLQLMQGELDFVGWDIRKALRLFRKSNAAMFEKLQSPIIYLEQTNFREELRQLMLDYFSPKAGLHHYLSMAFNYYNKCEPEQEVKLKSYFYLLRTTLASCWITTHKTVPPIRFQDMYSLLEADGLVEKLNELVGLKASVTEKYMHPKDSSLELFAQNCLSHCEDVSDELPKVSGPVEKLNELFRTTICNSPTALLSR